MSSFTYKNYDITITQTVTNVNIRIFDTKLFRVYENQFDKMSALGFGVGSITNFYKITVDCFAHLEKCGITTMVKDKTYNGYVKVYDNTQDSISIEMNYTNGLDFSINLNVPLIEESTTSDQLLSKRMYAKIEALQKQVAELETYKSSIKMYQSLLTSLEIPIWKWSLTDHRGYNVSSTITMPIISPTINVRFNSQQGSYVTGNVIFTYDLKHLNENFKKVLVEKIMVDGDFASATDFDLNNFPSSASELMMNNMPGLKTVQNMGHMTNLKMLSFQNCPELTKIYDTIKNIKIGQIKVTNCPKFTDYTLLDTKGYSVTVT